MNKKSCDLILLAAAFLLISGAAAALKLGAVCLNFFTAPFCLIPGERVVPVFLITATLLLLFMVRRYWNIPLAGIFPIKNNRKAFH